MTPESVMMMGTEAMKVVLALAAPLLLDYVRTLFTNLPYIIG